jgi:hypothetical protein
MKETSQLIEDNLLALASEMKSQLQLGNQLSPDQLSLEEQIAQLYEFIELAGEFEIAYELIISLLEILPFKLTGKTVVGLVEVSLLMRYKSDRDEDKVFDIRI